MLLDIAKISEPPQGICHHTNRLTYPRQRTLKRGMDMVSARTGSDYVMVLLEGWAARCRSFLDGRRQIMSLLIPGDFCELGLLWDGPLENSICAITGARVALLPKRELKERMSSEAGVALSVWREVLASATTQQEWTVNLGRRTASERLGHLFCEIFLRLEAIGQTLNDSCEFPLTQADLGDTVGLTAVHINRTLQQLRATGLVSLNKRRLTIHDRERLEEFSLFDPYYLHISELSASRSTLLSNWASS